MGQDHIKEDIKEQIRAFLVSRFDADFSEDPALTDDTDLFDNGYIDSMDSLVLLTYIEKTFSIRITAKELVSNPMGTLNEIAALVTEKTR